MMNERMRKNWNERKEKNQLQPTRFVGCLLHTTNKNLGAAP